MPPAEHAVLVELGARIRGARNAVGLTQEEAAHAAGMDWRRWQRIERGSANLTIRTLVRIAEALKTSFWELIATPTPPAG
ncbi:XRE family transcriptional regulator [bacterium]|nr:MAG: XRE family transcriptional regulator [bacterium]MCE7891547.1 XRE family transcriptional regulator [Sorangiineae bacterium PRO1]